MIMDASAAVAMLRGEPESAQLLEALKAAPVVRMSAASVLELAIVMRPHGPEIVDDFIRDMGIQVIGVDTEHLAWARHAHTHFGRGSGSAAKLTFGDCFSYAAARATGEPLLFTGDDFAATDVARAL